MSTKCISVAFLPCPCEVFKQHLYNLLCLLSLLSHAKSMIFLISPCFVKSDSLPYSTTSKCCFVLSGSSVV